MTSSARLQQEANVARAGLSSALEELKQSVTTTAITNGAVTFAKEGSNAVARAAVDRAMASPVAAMMIGAGILMLMIGDKKVGSAVGSLVGQGSSPVKNAAGSVANMASSAASAASDKVSGLADRISSKAGEATDQAKGMLAEGEDMLAEGQHRAKDMLADGQHRAKDLLAKGQEQGQQVMHQAQQMFEQSRGKFEQFAQEQPILVAALGVAFGAALGATLPLSKAEQQYLADPAKKAASKAGELAHQAANTVTDKLAGTNVAHKVSEVVEAVSSTVTQGLSRS